MPKNESHWKELDESVSGIHRYHGVYSEAGRCGSGVMDTNPKQEGTS